MCTLLITNTMAPYRIPLFNRLAQSVPDFHVIFLWKREAIRSWNTPVEEARFSYELLDPENVGKAGTEFKGLSLKVVRRVRELAPSVVIIGGWAYTANWLALTYAKTLGIPVIIWGGITANSSVRRDVLTQNLRKLFLSSADAYVTYSTRTAEEFIRGGAKSDRIFVGCNVGDVDYYYAQVAEYRRRREYLSEAMKWPRPLFLYVGQLIKRKGVDTLIAALGSIHELPWSLALAGSGEDMQSLQNSAAGGRLGDIYFTGFLQREELVRYYGLADIFVLPSYRDPGAIVLSEALASGLYVLASKFDGIAPDLIREGCNGGFIDPENCETTIKVLRDTIWRYGARLWSHEDIADSFMATKPLDYYASKFAEAVQYVATA